ncbi:hypothetical protein [Roseibium sp.]|uniref:capsular polysaccharide export protein, LipB/KpsS family n=1 Tax=Roseibium sp. TaxID=1936156 RepID=UPI003A96EA9A
MTRKPAIIDPSLKPISDKLDKVFGLLTGLNDVAFEQARRKALAEGESVTVILPGPLPSDGGGYPTSLAYIELVGDILAESGPVAEVASRALLSEAEVMLNAPGRIKSGTLQTWRETPPNPDFALHSQADMPRDDSEVLRGLFSGRWGSDIVHKQNGFWSKWANSAVSGPSGLDAHLAHVLDNNCLWFDPYFEEPCTFGDMSEAAALIERRWRQNDKPCHCYGAQYWNHPAISATFSGRGGPVVFHESEDSALTAASADGGCILSWAGRTRPAFAKACERDGTELKRIEDGFIRSVGLGAGLARGAMLAIDDLGIYYDPSGPSRLEELVNSAEVPGVHRQRAQRLIDRLIEARVSKYNYGRQRSFRFPSGREIVLVPGQVADDAAVRKSVSATIDCAACDNVNRDLLRLARERNPEAYIVFKPHPDVETGLRKGRLERAEVMRYADEVAQKADIVDLIENVDRVETFSSLSGFEALIRGKKVTVHGMPFYAGWGLCEELTVCDRRSRQRSLAELVYLAFFEYCRTIDPVTLLPCVPEVLVKRLQGQRQSRWHVLRTTVIRQVSWLGRKLGL